MEETAQGHTRGKELPEGSDELTPTVGPLERGTDRANEWREGEGEKGKGEGTCSAFQLRWPVS